MSRKSVVMTNINSSNAARDAQDCDSGLITRTNPPLPTPRGLRFSGEEFGHMTDFERTQLAVKLARMNAERQGLPFNETAANELLGNASNLTTSTIGP